jgi:hypothetical protein
MEWINIPMAKVAYELWIYNWKDNKIPTTREESATMIVRSLQMLLDWKITKEKIEELVSKYQD